MSSGVLLHYLLKEEEILDAVRRYAVSIQQAVELETQLPLGLGLGLFGEEAAQRRDRRALGNKYTQNHKWYIKHLHPLENMLQDAELPDVKCCLVTLGFAEVRVYPDAAQ